MQHVYKQPGTPAKFIRPETEPDEAVSLTSFQVDFNVICSSMDPTSWVASIMGHPTLSRLQHKSDIKNPAQATVWRLLVQSSTTDC